MKVLVTGAGGFIGNAVVRGLSLRGGCDIIGISRSAVATPCPPGVRFVRHDLLTPLSLVEPVDYVIHCAAIQNYTEMPIRDFLEANLAITGNVAAFCREHRVKGLIFTSSLRVHGDIRGEIVDEQSAIINPHPYGLSKYVCELMLREFSTFFPVIALRLCGIVGPGAKNIWLADILARALRGEDIAIFNATRPFNNIVHIDALTGFIHSLMVNGFSGFSSFPLAANAPLAIKEVVTAVIAAVASTSAVIDMGARGTSFTVSNRVAMEAFHYQPAATLASLLQYARDLSSGISPRDGAC